MRIIADTNTLISGFLWQGPPRQILELASQKVCTLYTSPVLIEEFAAVITRRKFDTRLQAAQLTGKVLVEFYLHIAELIVPEPLKEPACRDPDDDHILACALAAQADCIVSGDADLLDLVSYQTIPIITPAAAVHELVG